MACHSPHHDAAIRRPASIGYAIDGAVRYIHPPMRIGLYGNRPGIETWRVRLACVTCSDEHRSAVALPPTVGTFCRSPSHHDSPLKVRQAACSLGRLRPVAIRGHRACPVYARAAKVANPPVR